MLNLCAFHGYAFVGVLLDFFQGTSLLFFFIVGGVDGLVVGDFVAFCLATRYNYVCYTKYINK